MNRCLCLVYISSCMFLSLDRRAVQAHSAQGKTSVTGANMSNYSTLLPKAESTGPTVHIISASTGFLRLTETCIRTQLSLIKGQLNRPSPQKSLQHVSTT
ncbi:uncharacterized protein tmem123 isoform X3 [Puntigrus tetrazona]|uniref:uncharacterized protein tmem123 isoform X3 n=1 Tax=Puntigrus tetrazona TaxID=1606681 RepID=UPI001C894C09|nr:uncharacterized protein tmem123 isoform X3 [Puntigrus tetrazona]